MTASFLGAFAACASAEVVEIAWTAAGTFERGLIVAPSKFAELCGRLEPGESVSWSFHADREVDFNIHYHAGKDVVFPARQQAVAASQGRFSASERNDYCWMWSHNASVPVQVQVRLSR